MRGSESGRRDSERERGGGRERVGESERERGEREGRMREREGERDETERNVFIGN